jgi:hypothetical protein
MGNVYKRYNCIALGEQVKYSVKAKTRSFLPHKDIDKEGNAFFFISKLNFLSYL